MTDTEFHDLMAELAMGTRRKVVRSLLAGNDTQCFTSEQYVNAYCKADKVPNEFFERWKDWILELVPQHMESIGMFEVKPGVWARVP